MNYEPFTRVENPTLAHFRHFRHSVPRSFPTDCTILKGVRIITYFQTHSILTNKPNFRKAKMNVNSLITTDYENKWQRRVRKNKPNSNPIKSNLRKGQNERKLTYNKGLQKNDDFAVRKNKPNSNPISEKPKMNVNFICYKGI